MSLPTQEQIDALVAEVHPLMKEKGFYDPPLSTKALLMLILTEIGETVNADRKSKRYVGPYAVDSFRFQLNENRIFEIEYERLIAGTVEGELADACLRIFDFAGYHDLPVRIRLVELLEPDLAGNLFDAANALVARRIPLALEILFTIAEKMGIDLLAHIRLALEYCRLREYKHGKKY